MFPSPSEFEQWRTALGGELRAFVPELILCGTVVLMLLSRLVDPLRRVHLSAMALVTTAAAFWFAWLQWQHGPVPDPEMFSGLLISDSFAHFVRLLILGTLILVLSLSLYSGIPDREESADFTTLLIGATLGMMVMTQANHLLTVFLAVEMASAPSYGLAGFLKGRRRGSEAALKYVIYGAASAGVMLYGISLITAQTGSGSLSAVAGAFGEGAPPALVAGAAFLMVGLGFKLAAVPFHFWCPDVFEGAAAEVGAFLSVASKAAAIALTARIVFLIADAFPEALAYALGTVGAVTATLGNLAALGQSNLKRLLAYSTIAHAGYMILGLSLLNATGLSAVLFYLIAYLLMNFGAFAAVALIRNQTGSEELPAAAGLLAKAPVLVVMLTIFLMSLLGLPPLAGFAAKFQLFAALYREGGFYFGLLAVAVVNTAVSAFYYLRVVRVMAFDDAPDTDDTPAHRWSGGLYLAALAGGVVAVGLLWDPLTGAAQRAAVLP